MKNRADRKKVAEETLEILKNGYFQSSSGNKIDISELQKKAENSTKIYTPEESDGLLNNISKFETTLETSFEVVNQTTLDATRNLINTGFTDVLCLNFASAKNPGGGFLGGSQAQEESIARSTGLYNCQLKADAYYEINRKTKSCIYTDYMIYSPGVPIIKNEDGQNLDQLIHCGVITAPAVNKGAVKRNEQVSEQEIEKVMRRRIKKVLAIPLVNNHKNLVLGAWGCGVFQNNPIDIANYFKEILNTEFKNKFDKIVFAIYARDERFIKPFYEAFA